MPSDYTIVQGDVLEVLRQIPSGVFSAVLTDPPYGINFMGRGWDNGVPSAEVWKEMLRVCKPGAYLLSFGGTRKHHRLWCNIEDAGWEIRDSLMWLYAKGMPKPAFNVGRLVDEELGAERPITGTRELTGNAAVSTSDKGGTYGVQVGTAPTKTVSTTGPGSPAGEAWDDYGAALKPGYEPIVMARVPLDGTIAHNVLTHGCGAMNVGDCRIEGVKDVPASMPKQGSGVTGWAGNGGARGQDPDVGRWPANLLLDEEAGALLDEQTGERPSNPYNRASVDRKMSRRNVSNTPQDKPSGGVKERGQGASRFFFSSKVSTKERNAGCEDLEAFTGGEATGREDHHVGKDRPQAGAGRTGAAKNPHPTMKPISLTTWLGQLVRPPHGAILVPYSGVGSEMIGCLLAGWENVFGIELNQDKTKEGRPIDYIGIAHRRIRHWAPSARYVEP